MCESTFPFLSFWRKISFGNIKDCIFRYTDIVENVESCYNKYNTGDYGVNNHILGEHSFL